jgi:hypothetical protein
MPELVPRRRQARQPQRPRVERFADAGALSAEPALDELGMLDRAFERDRDVDAHVPRLVRCENDRIANDSRSAVPGAREHDLRAPAATVALLQHDSACSLVEVSLRRRRELRCGEWIAEREIVLLDADDVCEIGAEVQLDGECQRRPGLVAEHEVILEPLTDETMPRDREGVLVEAARERIPGVERRREVLDPAR